MKRLEDSILEEAEDGRLCTAWHIRPVQAALVLEDTLAIRPQWGEWPRGLGSLCKARQRRAIQAVIQARRFELVCWEAAQSPNVMSREMGWAAEAKMPAAESEAKVVVAPYRLQLLRH